MGFKRTPISFKSQFKVIFWLALVITLIECVNIAFGRSLNDFGLMPRELGGLMGVVTAPLLHGSFAHYLSNITTLCIFAFLLLQHGAVRFGLVTIVIVIFSGVLVWLFGRTAIHIGASGLIYGYFGYLLFGGWLSREFKLLFISLLVGFIYGGMIWGILPSMPNISWEFHLFGFLAGLFAAKKWGRVLKS